MTPTFLPLMRGPEGEVCYCRLDRVTSLFMLDGVITVIGEFNERYEVPYEFKHRWEPLLEPSVETH